MKRYALVRNATSRSQVESYLPSNYEVLWEGMVSRYPGEWRPPFDVEGYIVKGEDFAGWTLDGYVIPRFASGLIWAEEIDLSHPAMKEVPV